MKKFVVIGLALSLAACSATPADEAASMAAVQSQLPAGCDLSYAGEVSVAGSSRESRVFVVKCGDTTTVSETHIEGSGKNTYTQTDVNVIK